MAFVDVLEKADARRRAREEEGEAKATTPFERRLEEIDTRRRQREAGMTFDERLERASAIAERNKQREIGTLAGPRAIVVPPEPPRNALGEAFASVPAVQSAGAVLEGLRREEAAVAEPLLRAIQGEEDVGAGVVEGLQGTTVSPFTGRQAELGDVFRQLGAPEALAAFGGFAASLLLPSSLALGFVGRGAAKAGQAAVRRVGGATVRKTIAEALEGSAEGALSKAESIPRLVAAVPIGPFGTVLRLEFSKSTPGITIRQIEDMFEEFAKGGIKIAKPGVGQGFVETSAKRIQVKQVRSTVTPQAQKFDIDFFDEFGNAIPVPKKAFEKAGLSEQLMRGAEPKVNFAEQFKPMPRDALTNQTIPLGSSELAGVPAPGKANTPFSYAARMDEIVRETVGDPAKDIGFFRTLFAKVNIPSAVLSENVFGRAIFRSARFVEQSIIERLNASFQRKLGNVITKTGIREGTAESRQVGVMLDAFENADEVPKGAANFKDVMVKKLTREGEFSEDAVRAVVDDAFPGAIPDDNVVTAFTRMRKEIFAPIARQAKLPADKTVRNYFTRVYEELPKNLPVEKRVATLNRLAKDLGVDPALHESVMRKLKLVPENLPSKITPNQKFFGPLSRSRARNIPQSINDQLFLARNFDAIRVTRNYITGATRKIGVDTFLPTANLLRSQMVKELGPGARLSTYTKEYIDAFRGVPVGAFANNDVIRRFAAFEAFRQFTSKIGLRPITALINLTQLPLNTLPKLIGTSGIKGAEDFMVSLGQFFTRRGQKLIKASGVQFEVPGIVDDFKSARGLMRKISDATGIFFQAAERFNRGASFLASRRGELRRGLTIKNANQTAREFTDLTQFIFGKSNRPLALQTPLGSIIGRFKIFTINQVNFLAGVVKKPAEIATFVGMLDLLGGPDAFPFVEGLRQQLNDFDPEHPLTKALNAFQQNSVAGKLGIDLSGGRLGIPFYQEFKIFTRPGGNRTMRDAFFGLLGPTFTDLETFWKTVSDLQVAGVTKSTRRNIVRLLSTEAVDIAEAIEVAKTGQLTDPRGRVTFRVTSPTALEVPKKDVIKLALGFNTPEIAADRRRIERTTRFNKLYTQRKQVIMDAILDGESKRALDLMTEGVTIAGRTTPIVIDNNDITEAMINRLLSARERQQRSTRKQLRPFT